MSLGQVLGIHMDILCSQAHDKFWQAPSFQVMMWLGKPVVPLTEQQARGSGSIQTTACMQVLKRINAEIEARRRAGENLPPAPKTAIAGPEYFGFNQPEVRCPAALTVFILHHALGPELEFPAICKVALP